MVTCGSKEPPPQLTCSAVRGTSPGFCRADYISPTTIDSSVIKQIKDWYAACGECDDDHRSRIDKGAHFLNRALNTDDIEAYINFFVALDALFGVRGSVEDSIIAGVASLDLDPLAPEKTKWLFELRSEIVHGGSRYISEWPGYYRYRKHFRSEPMHDIRKLSQRALLAAPSAFRSFR